MDTTTIEQLATMAVSKRIMKSPCLSPKIEQNDREPSWDGHVYMYSGKTPVFTKRNFRGRIPVQVKGTECDDLSRDTIKYDAEVSDLKNYAIDGGVLYFVVYIADDGEKEKVYYAELTRKILDRILQGCRENQEHKRITLKTFPLDGDSVTAIFSGFLEANSLDRTIYADDSKKKKDTEIPQISNMRDYLRNNYYCQRLTADQENKELIRSFRCKRNPSLSAFLRYMAWEADIEGQLLTYLVKNKENQILAYFSLQCGSVFESLEKTKWSDEIREYQETIHSIQRVMTGKADEEEKIRITKLAKDRGESLMLMARTLEQQVQEKLHLLQYSYEDTMQEYNTMVHQVQHTYPAIELHQFCVNDSARSDWSQLKKKANIPASLGKCLFWEYVVPIVISVKNMIGCQYFYTYVADVSSTGTLVSYFQSALGFEKMKHIGVNKPMYDFLCTFMCQRIDVVEQRMKEFSRSLEFEQNNTYHMPNDG